MINLNPFRKEPQRKLPRHRHLDENTLKEILQNKVPENAVRYCTSLWLDNPFSFEISKTRSTCLGNYRFQNGHHSISINHDLNPFNFLITFIHEVAHQRVAILSKKRFRNRPLPHGKEWKSKFQDLLTPLLNESIFPEEILIPLIKHMRNPAASSTRDINLMKALKMYDESDKRNILHLEDILSGQSFQFKKRTFQKLETRRTRALCIDLNSKRKYTIPLLAEVSRL